MKMDSSKIGLQWLSSVMVVAVLGLAVGCGGGAGKTQDPTASMDADQKAVANLVGKVSDISGNLDGLRGIFTKEAQPTKAEADEYNKHMFSVGNDIVISGDNATMTVEIMTYEENATPVKKPWKAQKVSGEWKLSDAPM